jgi:hypothetical protein
LAGRCAVDKATQGSHGHNMKRVTMLANGARTSRAATCEEWDEDAQTTLPDTQTSANVAAKRSKPELAPSKSHRQRNIESDASKMNRAPTSVKDDASYKKETRRPDGLKLDTSCPERESRPYSSGPPPDHRRRSTSRPAAKRSIPKAEKPEHLFRHQLGECWICDLHGYHTTMPPELHGLSNQTSIPQSPLTASLQQPHRAPLSTKASKPPTPQPRTTRSQSHGGQRPMSFHAGMSQEAYHQFAPQPFSMSDWKVPSSPMSPYPPTAYIQTAPLTVPSHFSEYQQSFTLPNDQRTPAPTRPRRPEPSRTATVRGEPIIEQSAASRAQPALTKTASQREYRRSREPSLSREEDARKMPPPRTIPVAARPSLIKANTSASTPVSNLRERRHSNYGPVPAQSPQKERRSELPPSSFHRSPPSAYQNSISDKPAARQSKSYDDPKHNTIVNTSAPSLDRRFSISSAERFEVAAEAYQRSQGTNHQPLTVDAVRKIPRQSDNGSRRSVNSSSRGSSGGKTKTTAASNDITMTINGVTLGISGDSAENHSIKIQPKRNGGVNISVDEHPSGNDNKVTSLSKRSGSTSSSSKQSRRSSEKEVGRLRGDSLDHDRGRASKASSRSGKASFDDSQALDHDFGWG